MDNHAVRSGDHQSVQYNSHASRLSMDSCCDHGWQLCHNSNLVSLSCRCKPFVDGHRLTRVTVTTRQYFIVNGIVARREQQATLTSSGQNAEDVGDENIVEQSKSP
jgi:hypothetical protein